MKILVTGATGFVGQQLVQYLLENTDVTLCLAVRKMPTISLHEQVHNSRVALIQIHNISSDTHWHAALMDCDVVVHLAACIELAGDSSKKPLAIFRETNVEGTLNLARQAIQSGVKRFIYLSSIKVNGEFTQRGAPFGVNDAPIPQHPYSISKLEAERGLMALAEQDALKVVILRPPMVYGPDVNGNFRRIMSLLQKRIPLPFGALTENKRSFISVLNLVDLICTCLTHPAAENQILLVSDGHDLSTTELFLKIRALFNESELLFPIPSWVLNSTASLLRRRPEMMRLTGSLQVDISQTQQILEWQPRESVDDGLSSAVCSYINSKNSMLI
jgi:nucleoside-diphosphate-sugar epimerase